jgi:hypothetical protein
MATEFRLKRRVSGAAGAPSSLKTGELAWNMSDGIIYGGKGDDGGGVATSVVAIAKDGFVDPSTLYQPVDADLAAIAGLDATAGILVKTGANAYSRRSIAGTAGRIVITNGSGAAGNPTVDLDTVSVGTTVTGGSTKFTVDGYGRITNAGQASLSDLSAPTATFSFGAQLAQSSAVPSGGNDLTNKTYVDAAIAAARLAADAKESVRLATTADHGLTGLTAIDGVTPVAGDRILVRAQTAPAQNGIYVAAAGAWSRATDFDAWAEIPGSSVAVEEGTTYADSVWLSIANTGGTIGTTAIGWTRTDAGAGGGFTVAGDGLTSSGATINVVPGTGITVASDNVALTGQALALHNLTTAADKLIYATGVGTFATSDISSPARTLLAQTSQASMRTTGLGLGTMATQAASAVAITGGTIDGVTLDGGTF